MKNTKKQVIVKKVINNTEITIETGKLAPQANSAVLLTVGETSVLATVVSKPSSEMTDFFPLRVDYEERFYAGGIIGGSRFTRREGRPNDAAIVSGRLIDHAIRPLFPKDFMDDTQLIVTVLSLDDKNDSAVVGFLAATIALSTAGIPFNGPLIPLRVQKVNGEIKATLEFADDNAELDMISSYLKNGKKVQAIEAEGHEIPEQEVVNAIKFGAEASKEYFDLVNEFISESDVKTAEYTPSWLNKDAINEMKEHAWELFEKLSSEGITYKDPEYDVKIAELVSSLEDQFKDKYEVGQIKALIGEVQKEWVRDLVLNKGKRLDDREFNEIRELSAEVGVLPRVHGSGLFNRGLTQALTIATLASPSQSLLIQGMQEEETKYYMHHYNFPPYSTGEVGRVGGANRRAIGHGMLAEKALLPVLPNEDEFKYVIRLVSEVLSSNGSTSMAATCGSSLALMDAGVPIKSHVGGIGVGLFVKDPYEDHDLEDYKLLTDIVGMEDFAGYMDFKMTGTEKGMTAIQMELKLKGIPVELLDKLFEKSREARMKVLEVMNNAISSPRGELSEYAPKLEFVKIQKDQIGQVIGSGGAVIKEIMKIFEVDVDIQEEDDHGVVVISSSNAENIAKAKKYIEDMLKVPEVGEIYEGTVTRVEDYGAFVEILPGQLGLLHVSEYSCGYTGDMNKELKIGDKVKVKINSMDGGKISVSKKALEDCTEEQNNRGGQNQGKRPYYSKGDSRDNYKGNNRNNRNSKPKHSYR